MGDFEIYLELWHVGNRIRREILEEERAEYGKKIIANVSKQLASDYGNGFNEKNLRRMMQFAEVFPDEQIVVSLIRQLSWTHFIALIPLKEDTKRDFYAEMCRIERWNVKTLRGKIDSMLYERTALSRKPELVTQAELENLRKEDLLTPNLVFRDPYFLEFLNLNDRYLEKDLEDAIMRELEQFLLELGGGFSFLARQKRITIDFEANAQKAFVDWYVQHQNLTRKEDEEYWQSHLGKIPKLIGSLCIQLHLVENLINRANSDEISLPIFEKSLRLSDYYIAHARKTYISVESRELTNAKKILKMIHSRKLESRFKASDIYRNCSTTLKDAAVTEAALKYLEDKRIVA